MAAPFAESSDAARARRRCGCSAGFSLVELLIVIAVIVILSALLLPAIGMARATARQKQCASNQVQIWHAWTTANSRDPSRPVRGSQWNTRISAYLPGGTDVLFCPDDTDRTQPSSFGINDHAWRFGGPDSGRIVLLDYKQPEIRVVGQTVAQLDGEWPYQVAPRHFQQVNVAFSDGHVTAYQPDKIDPRFCDYYERYWRPAADSNTSLQGCVNSGEPAPTIPGSTTSSSTSATTTAVPSTTTTTTTTTTTGSTTSGGSTTTTTTTTTTTGGTTTGGPCQQNTSPAADRGLNWLARHQWMPDGYWSLQHGNHPSCNNACANNSSGNVCYNGATALALLPFLGSGNTPTSGPYRENVCRGVQYLMDRQLPSGSLLENAEGGPHYKDTYAHLIATVVLVETVIAMQNEVSAGGCGGTGVCTIDLPTLRNKAQLAVNYAVQIMRPASQNGGWGYASNPNSGDVSLHNWGVKALTSAQAAGLTVASEPISRLRLFLDSVRVGSSPNTPEPKYAYTRWWGQTFSGTNRMSTATQALLCRQLLGQSDPDMAAFSASLIYRPDRFYYNYHASLLLGKLGIGGTFRNAVTNAGSSTSLVSTQVAGGHADGSWWAPEPAPLPSENGFNWNGEGGRLFTTVMALLTVDEHTSHLRYAQ